MTADPVTLVPDLDVLSREQIDRVQRENLTHTLAAVRAHLATAHRWPGLDAVREPADLVALPPFTSAELHRSCPPDTTDLVLGPGTEGLVLRTSGTSGQPKVLHHSWEYYRRAAFLGGRGLRHALRQPARRVADCMHPADLTGAFLTVFEAVRETSGLCYPIGDLMPVSRVVALLAEYSIDTVVGSPALLLDIVGYLGANPITIPIRNLMFLGGAVSPRMHATVASTLPEVNLQSFAYATSENGPVGYSCIEQPGHTHHIHEDAFVLEVVDPDGAPAASGVEGDVVITTLSHTGMPLFRYRVGDRGRLCRGRCPCGSHALRLTLTGRSDESVTVDATTISRDLVMAQLRPLGIDSPEDCQVEIEHGGYGLAVRLIVSDRLPGLPSADRIRREMSRQPHLNRILTRPDLRLFEVERRPPQSFYRNARGKIPFFVHRDHTAAYEGPTS